MDLHAGGRAMRAADSLVLRSAPSRPSRREPHGRKQPYTTWRTYGGGGHSSQYSALDQINKSNVAQLEVAWSFPVGERSFVFNPIVVDGVMYVLARDNEIVALDAATGRELWARPHEGAVSARGINYWQSADGSDRRLLYLNAGMLDGDQRAHAADDHPSFGEEGRVDLRDGLARDGWDVTNVRPLHTSNPGRVFGNLMIVSLPAQGAGYASTPGDVQAYDVVHRQARVGLPQHPARRRVRLRHVAEGRASTAGGVHNWSELTVDEENGIVVHSVRHRALRLLRRQSRRATICSRTRSSRSTRARASGSGISSSCTTISGTTTCRRRRSC